MKCCLGYALEEEKDKEGEEIVESFFIVIFRRLVPRDSCSRLQRKENCN